MIMNRRSLVLMLILCPLSIGGYVVQSAFGSGTPAVAAAAGCTAVKVAIDEGYGVSRMVLRDPCDAPR
jgi:hypothetical protein